MGNLLITSNSLTIPFAIFNKYEDYGTLRIELFASNWLQSELFDTNLNSHVWYIDIVINNLNFNDFHTNNNNHGYFDEYTILNPSFSIENGKFIEIIPNLNNEIKIDLICIKLQYKSVIY